MALVRELCVKRASVLASACLVLSKIELLAKYPNVKAPQHNPMMPCVWPWWLGPRSRPELGGCRGGGRGDGGLGGLRRALRCPHSGLVEPLCQVLLILPNILL